MRKLEVGKAMNPFLCRGYICQECDCAREVLARVGDENEYIDTFMKRSIYKILLWL